MTATIQANDLGVIPVTFDFEISLAADAASTDYPSLALDLLKVGASDSKKAVVVSIHSRHAGTGAPYEVWLGLSKGKRKGAEGLDGIIFAVDDLTDVPSESEVYDAIAPQKGEQPYCCFDESPELSARLIRFAWLRIASLSHSDINAYREIYG